LLDTALSKTIEVNGKRVSGKRVLASLVVEAITTGKVTFPGEDSPSTIGVKDWLEFTKWFYTHIDGPARSEHDVNVEGGITVIWDAPRPDSQT
jgi:hypothetical protein